jgi:hypothetical protein
MDIGKSLKLLLFLGGASTATRKLKVKSQKSKSFISRLLSKFLEGMLISVVMY